MSGSILVSDFIEERWGPKLDAAAPGIARVILRPQGPSGDPASIEVAFFSGDVYPERSQDFLVTLFGSPRLRWLHSFSAGVDHPVFHLFLERGVRLSNSSGASAVAVAETVLFYMLCLSRDYRRWEEARRRLAWEPHSVRELHDAKLAIVGLGPIGQEVAAKAAAFGMNVVAVTRRPRTGTAFSVRPLGDLDAVLADADYVVLALPLTPATRGLLDRRRLALLRPTSFLINVARGELIDEQALAEALTAGRIAAAALDVFNEEPLPPSSPLWKLPNVILTPHSSGRSDASDDRASEIFLDNLARYFAGRELRNEVRADATEGQQRGT